MIKYKRKINADKNFGRTKCGIAYAIFRTIFKSNKYTKSATFHEDAIMVEAETCSTQNFD